MKILIASSNPHKLKEIDAIFQSCAAQANVSGDAAADTSKPAQPEFELVGLQDIGLDVPEPVEDSHAFEGNALIKARYYAQQAGLLCIADDSGLMVDTLGGAPGVHSARFCGHGGPREKVDLANNAKLLVRLGSTPIPRRTARFVCVMALAAPGTLDATGNIPPRIHARLMKLPQHAIVVRGLMEGRIITNDEAADPAHPECGRGKNGFGYDPLFFLPQFNRTSAELKPEQKNEISHRGNAARQMWQEMHRLLRE